MKPGQNDNVEKTIGQWLIQRNLQLVVAESCTGGMIVNLITDVPGSSNYFPGGIVAYSYQAKEILLGVKKDTLAQFGAVSRETVLEMARGVRQVFQPKYPLDSLIGLSVSGIAGPGGGMPGKPVGLVWVGLSTPQGDRAQKYVWTGNRLENKLSSAKAALKLVLEYLVNNQIPDEWPS